MSATDFRAVRSMPIRSFIKTVVLCSLSLMSMAAAPQQFNQPLVIPTGSWSAGIVAAGVSGDGNDDLIFTHYGATASASPAHVLFHKGSGGFGPVRTQVAPAR